MPSQLISFVRSRRDSNQPGGLTPRSMRRDEWLTEPSIKIVELLGLEYSPSTTQIMSYRLRRVEPGEPLCDAGAERRETFVMCCGLALRRHPDRGVPFGIGIAGPREVLGLASTSTARCTEALVAITAVDVVVLDTQRVFAGRAGRELMARIVAGPQSVASVRHLTNSVRVGNLHGGQRLVSGLKTLASLLGHDRKRLGTMVLHSADLAHWLAMPKADVCLTLTALADSGLVQLLDDTVHAIDTDALYAYTSEPFGSARGAIKAPSHLTTAQV